MRHVYAKRKRVNMRFRSELQSAIERHIDFSKCYTPELCVNNPGLSRASSTSYVRLRKRLESSSAFRFRRFHPAEWTPCDPRRHTRFSVLRDGVIRFGYFPSIHFQRV